MKTKLAIAILIAAPALPLCAADQLADKLILDGSRQSLLGSPLQPALDADPGLVARLKKYTPQERCEALERGYLATWEVRESKLYLIGAAVAALSWAIQPRRGRMVHRRAANSKALSDPVREGRGRHGKAESRAREEKVTAWPSP